MPSVQEQIVIFWHCDLNFDRSACMKDEWMSVILKRHLFSRAKVELRLAAIWIPPAFLVRKMELLEVRTVVGNDEN